MSGKVIKKKWLEKDLMGGTHYENYDEKRNGKDSISFPSTPFPSLHNSEGQIVGFEAPRTSRPSPYDCRQGEERSHTSYRT